MNKGRNGTSAAIRFAKQSVLPDHIKTRDNIWEKLKCRAEKLEYGSLVCEVYVHGGEIRQIDVTVVKERLRAD